MTREESLPDEMKIFVDDHSVKRYMDRDFGESKLPLSIFRKLIRESEGVRFDLETLREFEVRKSSEIHRQEGLMEKIILSSSDPKRVTENLLEEAVDEFNVELNSVKCYSSGDLRNVCNISSIQERDLGGFFPLFPKNRKETEFYAKTFLPKKPENYITDVEVTWSYDQEDINYERYAERVEGRN